MNVTCSSASVVYTIPKQSSWFDMNKVDDIERRALSECFGSRSNPKPCDLYIYQRNWMINEFRNNGKDISATFARKHLVGNSANIIRLHSFLEYWGLINHKSERGLNYHFTPEPIDGKTVLEEVDREKVKESSTRVELITKQACLQQFYRKFNHQQGT